MCSSEQSHITHRRIFLMLSNAKTVTCIAYEAHNRAYSCHYYMSTRHQGFYTCTVDAYCHLLLRLCAAEAFAKCFSCAVYWLPVFVICPASRVDLKPLPRMRNRKLTCCGLMGSERNGPTWSPLYNYVYMYIFFLNVG